jgi:ADP-ribose pyrophosphatase YjhB (NUDIX family)
MKQRNGAGEFPYQFDLPGGAADESDDGIEATLERELSEEVGIRSSYYRRIGRPIFEVRHEARKVVEYHLFLVVPFGPPKESEEAINLCWVNPDSALALSIAGLDREGKKMGPMGVLMYDGLSVLNKPFYRGPLTAEVKHAVHEISEHAFSLVDGGRYFGMLRKDGGVELYRRLNPFESSGCFKGSLEHLGT